MYKDNGVLFEKGCLPIKASDLCNLLKCNVELVGVEPEAVITSISFGQYYAPKDEGFLQIVGADDNLVINRIENKKGVAALTDHLIEGIPCIIVDDLVTAVFSVGKWLYQSIKLPAVVVSGSVGKTTTKRMINAVLSKQMRLFTINESRNTLKDLCCFIQDIKSEDQLVVWEVAENRKREVEFSSEILLPRIAAITNIGESHIGSIEGGKTALLESIQSITAGMRDDGVVIINADDPDSRKTVFDRKTLSVGVYDTSADCVAYNIQSTRKGTSFDLRFQNQVTHVVLSVFGVHNVYNAMMAFAIGVLMGINRNVAARALRKYHNIGYRQNILRFGGVVVYADCYNASAKSVSSAIQCFCDLPGIRGKRIAILGDIAEIEGHEEKIYKEVAKAIDDSSLDIVITYGKTSYMIQHFVKRTIEMRHCASPAELNGVVDGLKRTGKNAYLIKGSRSMKMEQNLRHCFPLHYFPMRAKEKLTIKYRWGE